jgi:hypothetical protein
MERATIFVGRITKSDKNCRPGNEQGVNHHENVDARRLFGGGMPCYARRVCATSAGDAGRRCSAPGKDTGRPEIGARQSCANYGGLNKTYMVGDWCSGRLFGVAWDDSAKKWQLREFMQTQLQITAGNVDVDGTVLAANCYCFCTQWPSMRWPFHS